MRKLTSLFAASLALPLFSLSAATFDTAGGDLNVGVNWSDGNTPTAGNPGTVGVNHDFTDGDNLADFDVTFTAGDTNGGGFGQTLGFSDGSFTFDGGSFDARVALDLSSTSIDIINSGSTFDVGAEPLDMGDAGAVGGSTASSIYMSAGTFGATELEGDGNFTIDGGSAEVQYFSRFDNDTKTMNFNGGSLLATATGGADSFGNNGDSSTLNFGSVAAGTVEFAQFSISNATLNWNTDSLMEFTITGANTSTYETLWDNDDLFLGGQNSTSSGLAFADTNFQVIGDTLSVVPEPSTYALLVGCLALGWVMVRRRA